MSAEIIPFQERTKKVSPPEPASPPSQDTAQQVVIIGQVSVGNDFVYAMSVTAAQLLDLLSDGSTLLDYEGSEWVPTGIHVCLCTDMSIVLYAREEEGMDGKIRPSYLIEPHMIPDEILEMLNKAIPGNG